MTWRERLLDVPSEVEPHVWWARAAVWAVVAMWGTSVWLSRMTDTPDILHLTVILFHEAGHILFSPFGEWMGVAGGTFGQLLMPLVCAVALHRHGDNFGAAIAMAWMAMSLMDASVYAFDAANPVLPLIGGGTGADSFHDFVYLFERADQLHHARGWARFMKAIGTFGALASLGWGARLLALQRKAMP